MISGQVQEFISFVSNSGVRVGYVRKCSIFDQWAGAMELFLFFNEIFQKFAIFFVIVSNVV